MLRNLQSWKKYGSTTLFQIFYRVLTTAIQAVILLSTEKHPALLFVVYHNCQLFRVSAH